MGRRTSLVLFGLALAGVAAATLLPIGWTINRTIVWWYYVVRNAGGPTWMSIPFWEFVLNMLLFAIPVAFARRAWPGVRWWHWICGAAALSLSVEVVQWSLLPRESSFLDVVANTSGAVLGVAATVGGISELFFYSDPST